jgi:hypothetical protein
MVLVLEKNRLDLGASSTSRSTSTALLSTRNPDSLPAELPEEPTGSTEPMLMRPVVVLLEGSSWTRHPSVPGFLIPERTAQRFPFVV